MMNILTEDGEPNNDTLYKLFHLRNYVNKIYDNFQACWEGKIFFSKDNFRYKDLVNLDAIQYAGSNEESSYSTPKH